MLYYEACYAPFTSDISMDEVIRYMSYAFTGSVLVHIKCRSVGFANDFFQQGYSLRQRSFFAYSNFQKITPLASNLQVLNPNQAGVGKIRHKKFLLLTIVHPDRNITIFSRASWILISVQWTPIGRKPIDRKKKCWHQVKQCCCCSSKHCSDSLLGAGLGVVLDKF